MNLSTPPLWGDEGAEGGADDGVTWTAKGTVEALGTCFIKVDGNKIPSGDERMSRPKPGGTRTFKITK